MSTKSAWGKVGAWAAEAEREEEEERVAALAKSQTTTTTTTFPSLKESISTTTNKTKKNKTKMTLQEFTQQPTTSSNKLTHQEMLYLPTGPKERSSDEYQLSGRGFSNYGSRIGSNNPRSFRFDENEGGGERRGRVVEPDLPSRADGVDNWGSMKRDMSRETRGDLQTGSKYGSLGGGGSSRADEVDNWGSGKKFVPQMTGNRQSGGFGSGFSRPENERWTRNEVVAPRNNEGGFSRQETERWTKNELPRSEPEVVVVEKVNRGNPFGAARPREEVLAEKGLDWKKIDLEVEEKKKVEGSRPGSSHSDKMEEKGGEVVKERKKVNPFGEAKPREVLLEEKGLDWKKIDLELEHKRVDRPETEEEKNLKQEIENLNKELLEKSGDEKISVQELIHKMEQELDLLVRELDDKVRYTQKTYERPGSGSGRPPSRPGSYEDPRVGFQDRPPSRPGSYEDSRVGYQDRPPSRPGAYEESRVGYQDRPPSRPGAYEDPRFNYHDRPRSRPGAYEEPRGGFPQRSFSSMGGGYQVDPRGSGGYQVDPRAGDYNERPRSRGSVNSWSRPGDDRRGVQGGGGGRGFFGSREVDRTGARW